ncbi:MAG TPA: hypothetical protein VF899_06440 [Pyrinomonadaceae bacterium]
MPQQIDTEAKVAKLQLAADISLKGIGQPSLFSRPECHGVL